MTAGHKWKPLQRAERVWPPRDELIAAWMQEFGLDREAALLRMKEEHANTELWANDLYQVERRVWNDGESVWLCIRRKDGWPGKEWRHFQQIKDELIGPECEAVELYPATSRLVDTSNKYHLYGCADPSFRFPFGYEKRQVQYQQSNVPGLRQQTAMQHHASCECPHCTEEMDKADQKLMGDGVSVVLRDGTLVPGQED